MKVAYSWAQASPGDWDYTDARDFAALPNRGRPAPVVLGQRPRGDRDNDPGWLSQLSVQGVCFNGLDHVAVAPYLATGEDGVRVWAWNDDPNDPDQTGGRVARIWTFLPLAPDPTFGSGDRERLLDSIRNEPWITEARRAEVLAWHHDPAHFPMNTRQSQVVYAEGDRYDKLLAAGSPVRPWAEFEGGILETIDPAITRHGIWVPDEHWDRQVEARTPIGWMHWNEHVPESECEWETGEVRHNRRMIELRAPRRVLREQRAQGRYSLAAHTITYYQRDTNRAHPQTYDHEDALETTAAASATESVTTDAATLEGWIFSAPANEPNSADWPNGLYRAQFNCAAASGGLIYADGLGNNAGFRHMDSSLAAIERIAPDEAAFSGTGLKLATKTWNPVAGSAGDRFGYAMGADGDSHGDAITLTLNTTDSYADGPWSAAGPQTITANGIASALAFGTAKQVLYEVASGIASAVALGSAKVNLVERPAAIASGLVFGSIQQLSRTLPAASVSPATAFGTQVVRLYLLPSGIAGGAAYGSPMLVLVERPNGIAATLAFGSISQLARTLVAGTRASGLTFGTASVAALLSPSGIASALAFGTAKLNRTLPVSGVASALSFGSARMVLYVVPSGVGATLAFGTARMAAAITPSGIASSFAAGTAQVNRALPVSGIASALAFGAARFVLYLLPGGIATGFAAGTPRIVKTITPSAIASGLALGAPSLGLRLAPTAIASALAFGTAVIVRYVVPSGIASGLGFGTATIDAGGGLQTIIAAAIAPTLALGTPRTVRTVHPSGVSSGLSFGTLQANLEISPDGLTTTLTIGTARVMLYVMVSGIPSALAFGVALLVVERLLRSPLSAPLVHTGRTKAVLEHSGETAPILVHTGRTKAVLHG